MDIMVAAIFWGFRWKETIISNQKYILQNLLPKILSNVKLWAGIDLEGAQEARKKAPKQISRQVRTLTESDCLTRLVFGTNCFCLYGTDGSFWFN